MKVNGVNWSGAVSARVIENENMVINGINATAANQETIGLVIGKVTQIGTYKVKGRTGNAFLFSQKSVIFQAGKTARLQLLPSQQPEANRCPSGTFFGTCLNNSGGKVIITEGKF